MISSLSIENFRCFNTLEVSGLTRMNILIGRNSSGKTSFLEAIFLASGEQAPVIALKLKEMRQLNRYSLINKSQSAYRNLWEDLFYDFDERATINIRATGTDEDSHSLRIKYEEEVQTLPFGQKVEDMSVAGVISFCWEREGAGASCVRPRLSEAGLTFYGMGTDHLPSTFFGPHVDDSPEENAIRFSELHREGEVSSLLSAMQNEFPFIEDLSTEATSVGSSVFAKLKDQRQRVPIPLVSDGVNRLLSILLAISSVRGGSLIIDQIEDGFYFERLPSIWRLVHQFASVNRVQIFATTHSLEAIKALKSVVAEDSSEWTLLKAERHGSDSMIRSLSGSLFQAALEQGNELR